MRTDEQGHNVPSTLREYLELCTAIVIDPDKSKAIQFLRDKISAQGPDQVVVVPDSQMRAILFPMLAHDMLANNLHPDVLPQIT